MKHSESDDWTKDSDVNQDDDLEYVLSFFEEYSDDDVDRQDFSFLYEDPKPEDEPEAEILEIPVEEEILPVDDFPYEDYDSAVMLPEETPAEIVEEVVYEIEENEEPIVEAETFDEAAAYEEATILEDAEALEDVSALEGIETADALEMNDTTSTDDKITEIEEETPMDKYPDSLHSEDVVLADESDISPIYQDIPEKNPQEALHIPVDEDDEDAIVTLTAAKTISKQERRVKRYKFLHEALGIIRYSCITFLIGVLVVLFVIQRSDVSGSSMEDTLHTEDVILVEMVSHFFRGYQRGDIVILDAAGMAHQQEQQNRFVKRVIGVPGETITIEGGFVYINGERLDEPYLMENTPTLIASSMQEHTWILGEGEYFCMGDNRTKSLDSRALGPFTRDRIKGHALVRIYPFDRIGFLIGS